MAAARPRSRPRRWRPSWAPATETQFQFQGVISSQKPFRDWLTEVLNCCLGFYTWEFGKLKLGCRINASAGDAYTTANMLFQSLRLTPIQAAFEHLVLPSRMLPINFRRTRPSIATRATPRITAAPALHSPAQMHSVGCSTLSQALRIAATRTREEIGGVNPTEWRNARAATWGTTLLGLGNEVGQVVSITHPDVPGGTGNFRIQRWSAEEGLVGADRGPDRHPSMYDLDVGPKPMDVVPAPLPGLFYPIPLGPVWAPYQVQAAARDALFPNEWTFDSNQTYTTMADGSALASLIVTGKLPVNEFSATGAGAPGIGSISQSTTGGSLPANATLRVAHLRDRLERASLGSVEYRHHRHSGSGTDSFTLEDITWPAVAGLASYVLFVATQDDLICAQATRHADGRSEQHLHAWFDHVRRAAGALHLGPALALRFEDPREGEAGDPQGVAGLDVDSVTAPNQIVCGWLIDQPASQRLQSSGQNPLCRRAPGEQHAVLSVTITAYDHTTGTLTVSPQAVAVRPSGVSIQQVDTLSFGSSRRAEHHDPTQITDSGHQT